VAEEITREELQDIVRETVQETLQETVVVTTNSGDGLIQTLGIMLTIGASVAALLLSLRKHNQKQETLQRQFNKTQEQSKNLEFMKQLEYYCTELVIISNDFSNSSQDINDCYKLARKHLLILERLSFLRVKELIDQEFLQFLENDFNVGRIYFRWLEIIQSPALLKQNYPNFQIIKKTIVYSTHNLLMGTSFYYYARKSTDDSFYDARTDKTDPKLYTATSEDVNLLKPT